MGLINPLATDLSGIQTSATTISSLANLVMATPQSYGYQPLPAPTANGLPSLAPFPPALLFHYEGEQICTIESDITDHFIENNTTLVDQIGLKPEIFKTSGFIGELNDVLPQSLQFLKQAANVFVQISAYTPQLSITALVAYTQALLLYEEAASIAQSAVSAYSSLTGTSSNSSVTQGNVDFTKTGALQDNLVQNLQQNMFQQLYGYWNSRTLFNIQTPWCIFTNMAILSFRAIQDATTQTVTDFEVTFKKIRTASTFVTNGPIGSGSAATQSAVEQNLGIGTGFSGEGAAVDYGNAVSNSMLA